MPWGLKVRAILDKRRMTVVELTAAIGESPSKRTEIHDMMVGRRPGNRIKQEINTYLGIKEK